MIEKKKKKKRSFFSRYPKIGNLIYNFFGVMILLAWLIGIPLFLILPRTLMYPLAKIIALKLVFPKIRKNTIKNLNYAFDRKLSKKRLEAISKKVAINSVWSILDTIYLYTQWWHMNMKKFVVEVKGNEIIMEAFKLKNGRIAGAAHYNCFELQPVFFNDAYGHEESKNAVVARTIPNKFLRWLSYKARELNGVETLFNDIKGVIRHLRQNRSVGILPDLFAKKDIGYPVNFFGKPTMSFDIHFRVASLTNSVIIPSLMMRRKQKPWTYYVQIYDFIKIKPKATHEEIMEKVQELNNVFEYHFRRFPGGWVWFHNKWRIL